MQRTKAGKHYRFLLAGVSTLQHMRIVLIEVCVNLDVDKLCLELAF
jgi:hypothetical protein